MPGKEKIEIYEKRLEAERRHLLKEIERNERPTDFGDDVDSFEEETDEAEELGNQMAVNQALRDRLSEIDSALNKILKDEFGRCEKCGREISEQILDIVPESQLCATCKRGA